MYPFRNFVFRMENVTKSDHGALDTTKCVAVGFLNVGSRPAFLNRVLQIPDFNPASPINPFFFPINNNERDATRYQIYWNKNVQGEQNVLVIYKELILSPAEMKKLGKQLDDPFGQDTNRET